MPSILSTLADLDAPATFFLTGRWLEMFPDHAATIAARYLVGNHTYSHPHLPDLSDAGIRDQILRAEQLIRTRLDEDPRPLFRFPYGDSDARTLGIVNRLGYGSIRWTVDTLGWKGTKGGQSVDSVVARVVAAMRPGAIVLMHVGSAPDHSTLDADALPRVIAAVRGRGYKLVTVASYVD